MYPTIIYSAYRVSSAESIGLARARDLARAYKPTVRVIDFSIMGL